MPEERKRRSKPKSSSRGGGRDRSPSQRRSSRKKERRDRDCGDEEEDPTLRRTKSSERSRSGRDRGGRGRSKSSERRAGGGANGRSRSRGKSHGDNGGDNESSPRRSRSPSRRKRSGSEDSSERKRSGSDVKREKRRRPKPERQHSEDIDMSRDRRSKSPSRRNRSYSEHSLERKHSGRERRRPKPERQHSGSGDIEMSRGRRSKSRSRRNRSDSEHSLERKHSGRERRRLTPERQPSVSRSRSERKRSKPKLDTGGGSDDGTDEGEVTSYSSVLCIRRGFSQNIVAGMVAFTGPGLFNAMQGLGNAGGSDPMVAATMNATLYATFSIFGILSGTLFNLLGTKILMSFGALTYAFYAISVYLWGQVDDKYGDMAVFASAVLGLGAACLWGAQGTMTLSYAMENQKGLFFGLFWLIFNMGGVMGGFISMGINSGPAEERASSVTPETYFTFCGLMIAGSVFAFMFVIRPSSVVKSDGSAVVFEKTDSAEGFGELREVAKLFCNRYMLLLTPLIVQSNWFYAYEFGGINGLLFDAPTRGLNSAMYWGISGASAYVCGTNYLDKESAGGRRQRAIRGLVMISVINLGQWFYAIIYQFSTGYDKGNSPDPLINYRDGGAYAAPMLLFMYCGLADSLVQTYAYWIIGAISNSPKTLSRFVGYYKGIQSFGACLAWIIEAKGTSYRAQLLICSFLATFFILPTYMVAKTIQDEGVTNKAIDGEDLDDDELAEWQERYA